MKVIKTNDFPSTDGSFTRSTVASYWNESKVLSSAAIDVPRFNYNPDTSEFEGITIESASTNLVLNSTTLSTQSVTVTSGVQYTCSFYGTGSITLSGAHSAVMTGTGAFKLTQLTFTTSTTSITLTVTGTVSYGQLELGTKATSRIITTGSSVTRAADTITGTGLIYTTVTDPNAAWNSGTTYNLADVVRYQNKLWESTQASNTNHTPTSGIATWWLELGPDNMHAAFDGIVGTETTATTQMTFVLKLGAINSAALINVDAATSRITLFDPIEGLVYSDSQGLAVSNIVDWYDYFYDPSIVERTQIIYTGIPSYINSVITLRLDTGTGETTTIGQALFGILNTLGGTQYGASSGITDYSVKETDEFGTITFVERAFSKKLSAQVFVDNNQLNKVQKLLISLRAKPSVWIASDVTRFEETLIIYGYYRDFNTVISYPSYSLCSLEIEGLT